MGYLALNFLERSSWDLKSLFFEEGSYLWVGENLDTVSFVESGDLNCFDVSLFDKTV